MVKEGTKPGAIDIWSFGATLLELLTGIPHWLNYKCRVVDKLNQKKSNNLKIGAFAVKSKKIIENVRGGDIKIQSYILDL